jgi:hypothetical protein
MGRSRDFLIAQKPLIYAQFVMKFVHTRLLFCLEALSLFLTHLLEVKQLVTSEKSCLLNQAIQKAGSKLTMAQ